MELALYCPVYGYYEKEGDTVGRRGDYYTSVSVGPLFGELLALQFARWLRELRERADKASASHRPAQVAGAHGAGTSTKRPAQEAPLCLVEAGAHDGRLAVDILKALRAIAPDIFEPLQYWLIEPSAARQQAQQRRLAEFQPKTHWVRSLDQLSARLAPGASPSSGTVRGIIFSNELLDAMPVRRLGWDAGRSTWFEWGVTCEDGRFVWMRLPLGAAEPLEPPSPLGWHFAHAFDRVAPPDWPVELLQRLPNGFTVEISPQAAQWWDRAARSLLAGKLLTFDYGLTTDQWLAPERSAGTLRAYRAQHVSSDVLANPGEQDLTAHVNFTAIQQMGEAAGLQTEALLTQEHFLSRIAAGAMNGNSSFGDWTGARIRQFQTLTHPNHLGHAFRVLIQAR